MIVVGSMGIPLSKNLGILLLWLVPTCVVSTSYRLALLDILCELGKFDLMGTFSLFLSSFVQLFRSISCEMVLLFVVVFLLLFLAALFRIRIERYVDAAAIVRSM